MKRLVRLCLVLLPAVAGLAAPESGAPSRPNILFILADDLGYGDLASYGHERIATPNLDRLAAEGTRFTQFYVSHSVCSPTRVSAITGQYPSRWHMYSPLGWLDNNARRGMPDWLDVNAPSLPRALQAAGYRTALLGKWHLGGGSGRDFGGKAINSADAPPVASYGFDEARAFAGNGPTWLGTKPVPEGHETYPYDDKDLVRWSSRILADASIEFLERHTREQPGQPFMLNVWLHDPHVPNAPDEAMLEPYRDIDDPGVRAYYAVVTHMDQQIGRILAKLDELGMRENTLVIFYSDNGAAARQGSKDTGRGAGLPIDTDTAGSNGPLRGWKWHLYEGGIRVPLIVRWPAQVPAGRTDTTSVLNICDFTPTALRLAGALMPEGYESDGIDVVAALEGRPFARRQPMFWHTPTAVRRGPPLAIRDGDWKLLIEPDGTLAELYDLSSDIAEANNLASKHPERAADLQAKLRTWHRSLPKELERPVTGRIP